MKLFKNKSCKACGSIFPQYKSTEVVCSIKCAVDYQKLPKQQEKIAKQAKKREAKEFNAFKENHKQKHKSLTEYESEAKKEFQRWIRERDADQPCISCGNYNTDDWAGGHYHPAGIYSGVIFNELNCHKQCNSHCNKFLGGNLIEYRKHLSVKIGEDNLVKLEQLANDTRKYKWTREQLIEIKERYSNPYSHKKTFDK